MSYLIDTVDGQKDVLTKTYVGDKLVLNTSDGDYVEEGTTHVPYDAEAIEAAKNVGGNAGETPIVDATEAAEAAATAAGINAGTHDTTPAAEEPAKEEPSVEDAQNTGIVSQEQGGSLPGPVNPPENPADQPIA